MKAWAIVYTSNTGFTKRYAEMLSAKVGVPVYSYAEAKRVVEPGAPVIYLGWLMANSIKGFKKANKQYEIEAVCGVGLSGTGTLLDEVRKANSIPEDMPLFTLQGGMNHNQLKGINKLMIQMLIKSIESKKEKTENDEKKLKLIKKGGDFVSEENLAEVLKWCNE